MAKQPRVATDPELLKPIIEAVIFASEEPLSPRALIRLLAGDKENERVEEEVPPLVAAMNGHSLPVPTAEEDVTDAIAEAPEMESDPVATAVEEVAEGADSPEKAGRETSAREIAEPESVIEGDRGDLADAMHRVEGRVDAASLRPENGTIDQAYIRALIDELNDEYLQTGRAFRIVEVAGGFQFATVRDYGEFVAMLSKDKSRRRLSPAALETLAIIAYRQPVSKPEVEAIRGVNCDQVLLNLMEKNLVAITGRSEAVGRPLLYGTTDDFLRSFGLKGIGDLPKLREIEELMEEDAYSAERAEVITIDEGSDVEEIEALVGAAGQSGDEQDEGGDGKPVEEDIPGADGAPRSTPAVVEARPEQDMEPVETPLEPETEAEAASAEHDVPHDEGGAPADERIDEVALADDDRSSGDDAADAGRSSVDDMTDGNEGGGTDEDLPDEARVREGVDVG